VTGATLAGQLAGIYHDTTGGGLYYDADGVGGAAGVRFASLNGGLALNSLEFTVIE
jgi:Ca2+-binding RTX toxin-like protein